MRRIGLAAAHASAAVSFYVGLPLLGTIIACYGIYRALLTIREARKPSLASMCRAERKYAPVALAAWERHNASIRRPFGDGRFGGKADDAARRHVLFPGMSHSERMDELRALVGLSGALSLDEATEGVRRALACIDPWMEGHASKVECTAIAASCMRAVCSHAAHPSRLGACGRPWRPKAAPPSPCPPLWLEWVQIGLYASARRLFNALGLTSCHAATPAGRLHWWDSGCNCGNGTPPMLLIHGMFTTGASMCPLALLLQRRRRVVVIDLPGFDYSYSCNGRNGSDGAHSGPRPCSLASSVEAVCWLVTHLTSGSLQSTPTDLAGRKFSDLSVSGPPPTPSEGLGPPK